MSIELGEGDVVYYGGVGRKAKGAAARNTSEKGQHKGNAATGLTREEQWYQKLLICQ